MKLKQKADYCLGCINKNCMKGCPLSNDITESIRYVKEGNLEKAYNEFSKTNFLASICGRICPHTRQCQGKCIRSYTGKSVKIGEIEAEVGDYGIENNLQFPNISNEKIDKKVAIIGSGPAGITCAAKLKILGVKTVDLYEKKNYLGGLLYHGIPDFRLSKDILEKTYNKIINLGINVYLNKELGKDFSINDLKQNYDAIFIAIGANISTRMNIEGANLNGVYGGNELLEYKNFPDFKDKSVAIIGGGNVAMDTSRTIKRLGAKNVYVIYRRAHEQMPAEEIEIQNAIDENIQFLFQNNVVKIIGDNKVEKIECIKTKLVDKGEGRLSPINIEGTNYQLDMDYVVFAIGSKLEEKVVSGLDIDKKNKIKIDENYRTSDNKIYAGGDAAGVESSVAWASCSGIQAANNIFNYLKSK